MKVSKLKEIDPTDITQLMYELKEDKQFIDIYTACNNLEQYEYDKLRDIYERIDKVNMLLDTLRRIVYTVK